MTRQCLLMLFQQNGKKQKKHVKKKVIHIKSKEKKDTKSFVLEKGKPMLLYSD